MSEYQHRVTVLSGFQTVPHNVSSATPLGNMQIRLAPFSGRVKQRPRAQGHVPEKDSSIRASCCWYYHGPVSSNKGQVIERARSLKVRCWEVVSGHHLLFPNIQYSPVFSAPSLHLFLQEAHSTAHLHPHTPLPSPTFAFCLPAVTSLLVYTHGPVSLLPFQHASLHLPLLHSYFLLW